MGETSLGSASVEQEVALFRLPHLMFLRSPSKERKEERKKVEAQSRYISQDHTTPGLEC